MIFYLTLAMVTILIAAKVKAVGTAPFVCGGKVCYSRQQIVNRVLFLSLFTILFLASALRINTGNDYSKYVSHCHDVYVGRYVVTEPGFNAIVKLVYGIAGREVPLAIFAIFAFGTILFFLLGMKKQSEDFPLSFYLFMTLGLYFTSYNTVRYYLALAIVFYAMSFAKEKRIVPFIALVLTAMLFHKTAIVVLPLYLLANLKLKIYHVILLGLMGLSGLFFQSGWMALFTKIYPHYLKDEELMAEHGLSVINVVRCFLILVFCAIYYKKVIAENHSLSFYFNLNLGAFILYSCFSFIPFYSRIGYYLNVCQILLLPGVIKGISELKVGEKAGRYYRLIVLLAGALYFAAFLYKAYDIGNKILPYHCVLFP